MPDTEDKWYLSGPLGIGTAAPYTKLHIMSQEADIRPGENGYGNPMLYGQHIELAASQMWGLKNSYGILHTWDSDSLFIGLKDEGSDQKHAVIAFGDNDNNSLRILFTAPGDPPPEPKELLRVTSEGNVGIGTTDTSKGRLVVEGTVAAAAFVGNGIVPRGVIAMWFGALNNIPAGWAICDGQNGTPDLRDRFVVAAGRAYMPGAFGGPDSHLHPISSFKITTDTDGAHQHQLPKNWYHRSFEDGGYTGIDVGGKTNNIGLTEATSFSAHAHGISLPDRSTSSDTSENRPRWYALLYIMKL